MAKWELLNGVALGLPPAAVATRSGIGHLRHDADRPVAGSVQTSQRAGHAGPVTLVVGRVKADGMRGAATAGVSAGP